MLPCDCCMSWRTSVGFVTKGAAVNEDTDVLDDEHCGGEVGDDVQQSGDHPFHEEAMQSCDGKRG